MRIPLGDGIPELHDKLVPAIIIEATLPLPGGKL
jgi:hypothetical protein